MSGRKQTLVGGFEPSSPLPEIAEPLLLEAMTAGLSEAEALSAWAKYGRWSMANYPNLGLGGSSWTKHIAKALAWKSERAGQTFVDPGKADRERREAAEAAAYDREAVSFPGWVSGLQSAAAAGKPLPAWEQMVVAWSQSTPSPGGMLEFMAWYAEKLELVKTKKKSAVYVSPAEQRRSDLVDLDEWAEEQGRQ